MKTGEKYNTFFSKNTDSFVHVFESNTTGIKVISKRKGDALRHFNWGVGRTVAIKRLQILLETHNPEEALKWAPQKLTAKEETEKKKKKKKMADELYELESKYMRLYKAAKKPIEDQLKELEKKIAAITSGIPNGGPTRDQYLFERSQLRKELEALRKNYSLDQEE